MDIKERKYLKSQMKHFRGTKATIVEIGSWKGISSMAISEGIKKYCFGSILYCVDIWDESWYDKNPDLKMKKPVIDVFEENMKPYPHKTMKMTSLEAVKSFGDESVGFIFIDADHSYEAVKADIQAWLPKLKKGCIMCGHDYSVKKYGVQKAVNEIFGQPNLPARTIWEIVK